MHISNTIAITWILISELQRSFQSRQMHWIILVFLKLEPCQLLSVRRNLGKLDEGCSELRKIVMLHWLNSSTCSSHNKLYKCAVRVFKKQFIWHLIYFEYHFEHHLMWCSSMVMIYEQTPWGVAFRSRNLCRSHKSQIVLKSRSLFTFLGPVELYSADISEKDMR